MVLGRRSQPAPRDELLNFNEAMQTAVDDGEPGLALALGVALRGEWEQHGMPTQVQALMERALAQRVQGASTAEIATAAALLVHSHLVLRAALLVAGESEKAQGHASAALALAGTQPALRAAALLGQSRQHWERSRDHAPMRPLLDEALQLARQEHAVETEAGVVSTLATLAFHVDDDADEAIALYSQAQALYESAGMEQLGNRMLFTKANCHAKRYRFDIALEMLDECERRFIASGHVAALPELANVQGFLYAYMVRWRDAELAFARCTMTAAQQQNRYMLGFGMWNLARPVAHQRKPETAALLMAFSARFWVTSFGPLVKSDLRYVEQIRRLVRVQVGAEATRRLWERAAALTLPQALALAAQSLENPTSA
jgi:tetratricopeptide (TPR) repeat protein